MTHVLAAGLPLTIGLVLAVAAARAGRRPPSRRRWRSARCCGWCCW
ncbi:hypothetical protein [Actinomadura keratinilytica]